MVMLSKYLSLEQFEHSDYAVKHNINNKMPVELLPSAYLFGTEIYDRVVDLFSPAKVVMTSGYRCDGLNQAVKGQPTSQHKKSQAMDFLISGVSCGDVYSKIIASDIVYDQLICEHVGESVWIHLSYATNKRAEDQRKQAIPYLLKM